MATRKITKAVPAKSAPVVTSTPVRNTAIPPKTPVAKAKPAVTQEAIAMRAYEIWRSGKGGSEQQNWIQAEHELKSL